MVACNAMVSKAMSPEERAKVFKALADRSAWKWSTQGSQCGAILAESLGISVALLCHYWEVLLDPGLLEEQREGQLRVCTVDAERSRDAINMGAALAQAQVPVSAKASPAKKRPPLKRAPKLATVQQSPRPPAKKAKQPSQRRSRTSS